MRRVDPAQKTGADVRRMFDAVAPRYDLLNRLLSAGIDVRWRRQAVSRALDGFDVERRVRVVDLCCGTGDLSFEFAGDRRVGKVVAFDFSPEMVARGRGKRGRLSTEDRCRTSFAVGDALQVPLGERIAEVVSVAFGLRNLVAPARGVAEFARLLVPGGRLVVLEFFAPDSSWMGAAFRAYFRHIVPWIGRAVMGGEVDAYRYLPESVEAFASAEDVAGWFTAAGLCEVTTERFLFGAVGLIRGRAPGSHVPGRRRAEDPDGSLAARERCAA